VIDDISFVEKLSIIKAIKRLSLVVKLEAKSLSLLNNVVLF
jgi:hypothetical protein